MSAVGLKLYLTVDFSQYISAPCHQLMIIIFRTYVSSQQILNYICKSYKNKKKNIEYIVLIYNKQQETCTAGTNTFHVIRQNSGQVVCGAIHFNSTPQYTDQLFYLLSDLFLALNCTRLTISIGIKVNCHLVDLQ